jgi:hypothetical protein
MFGGFPEIIGGKGRELMRKSWENHGKMQKQKKSNTSDSHGTCTCMYLLSIEVHRLSQELSLAKLQLGPGFSARLWPCAR